MADLADEGYLEQPHTSAGRIPTAKAYRVFVRSLTAKRLLEQEIERLRRELSDVDTLGDRVELSSHVLTEMTRSFGVAAAIPAASQILDQVELLGLGGGRILMVVVTRDKMVHNRVVHIDEPLSASELTTIRNYINRNYSGLLLAEVRRQLQIRIDEASAAYDAVQRRLMVLFEKGLLDLDMDPEVHMEGASNLVGIDFHLTREKMRELFRTLEEKKRILTLLDRFLEAPEGEISVHVGLEEAHPSLRALSLIGVSVCLPDGLSAKIAVLGPMRMNYQRAMSSVMLVGHAFQSLPV
jgi:heat-inducible transcriptional repressor